MQARDQCARTKSGGPIYALTYLGEGVVSFWMDGKVRRSAADCASGGMVLEVDSPTKNVWWVQIATKGGRIGWTNETDNFTGKSRYE